MTLPNLNFVAVDFETANFSRASTCAVGLTKVEAGQVADTYSWPIQPHQSVSYFHPDNIRIHGITPAMAAEDGISWHESLRMMNEIVGKSPAVIAHNSGFDRSVWNHTNQVAGIPDLAPDFYCTFSLSRELSKTGVLQELPNHRLNTLADYFSIQQLHHHDAGEDSLVASLVACNLVDVLEGDTVPGTWGRPTSTGPLKPSRPHRRW